MVCVTLTVHQVAVVFWPVRGLLGCSCRLGNVDWGACELQVVGWLDRSAV